RGMPIRRGQRSSSRGFTSAPDWPPPPRQRGPAPEYATARRAAYQPVIHHLARHAVATNFASVSPSLIDHDRAASKRQQERNHQSSALHGTSTRFVSILRRSTATSP